MSYELEFHPKALKEWKGLEGNAKAQLKLKLERRLEHPRIPKAALHGMQDCYKIKHENHRLIYRVIDGRLVVLVLAVGARDKLAAYKAADSRLDPGETG